MWTNETKDVTEERAGSEQQPPRVTVVRTREFLDLALSRRKLLRSDGTGGILRGLFDPKSGIRYVIEEETLRRGLICRRHIARGLSRQSAG